MIAHRCQYAGVANPFTEEALESIYIKSRGVPRNILKLCALAYEMKELAGVESISADFIVDAAPEVAIQPRRHGLAGQ